MTAFEEGIQACRDGKQRHLCPYPDAGDPRRAERERGWDQEIRNSKPAPP
jgi:hypothetical protein